MPGPVDFESRISLPFLLNFPQLTKKKQQISRPAKPILAHPNLPIIRRYEMHHSRPTDPSPYRARIHADVVIWNYSFLFESLSDLGTLSTKLDSLQTQSVKAPTEVAFEGAVNSPQWHITCTAWSLMPPYLGWNTFLLMSFHPHQGSWPKLTFNAFSLKKERLPSH